MHAIEGIGVLYLALEDLVCGNVPPRAIFSVNRDLCPPEIISERDSPLVKEISMNERLKCDPTGQRPQMSILSSGSAFLVNVAGSTH